MKYILLIAIELVSLTTSDAQVYTSLVNPFIGTGGHGHTYPGAVMPHGMVQLSPDTRLEGWDGCSGYHYSDKFIYGFTHTHLSGTGVSDWGDILLMPTTATPSPDNKIYGSGFLHENEKASPGFYSVNLENGVSASLTVTPRTGMHKYEFPNGQPWSVILDLEHRDNVISSSIKLVDSVTVTGMRQSSAWAANQYVFFVIKFSQAIDNFGFWMNDSLLPVRVTSFQSKNSKGYFQFQQNDKPLMVKLGLSSVSIEGAERNLIAENDDWDFEKIHNTAIKAWEKELSKIIVEDDDINKKTIFYTALYHTAIVPNINMDVDGQYRGRDNKIHTSKDFLNYSVFSLWDTYRATHPLYTIIDKARTLDYIKTFLAQYRQGGKLPVWELSSNETECMIGYHSVLVIVDAYMKGIKAFNATLALEAMKKSATWPHYGLPSYMKKAMIEADDEQESVSKTLEYAYDDWCIAVFARAINRKEDYRNYLLRAQYYKNLLDTKTAFMRPRKNGDWIQPFDPREVNNNFTEANSWQYSFYMPQDVAGYMKLTGGKKALEQKLDDLFSADSQTTGREQSDITGLIGQYAHGNEPSHHIAYLYNFAGTPWKTQEKVHEILKTMYQNAPDGLSGNEDCGQMSAWYIFSAMGFYPVTPGLPEYVIGSPAFKRITVNLENGKKFIIERTGNEKHIYIDKALLNGASYNKSFLAHADIMKGGTMKFYMAEKPGAWGTVNIPVTSIAEDKFVINPVITGGSPSFRGTKTIEITHPDKNVNIYFTTDGNIKGPGFQRYSSPIQTDSSLQIMAVAIDSRGNRSAIVTANYKKMPHNWQVKYISAYEQQYSAGGEEALVDGLYGNVDWRRGNWQGFQGNDLEIIIHLNEEKKLRQVIARFLQDTQAWIILPSQVEIYSSLDGTVFNKIYEGDNFASARNTTALIVPITATLKGIPARYIKVVARQYGKLPTWHLGAGGESHVFIDEIEIE